MKDERQISKKKPHQMTLKIELREDGTIKKKLRIKRRNENTQPTS